MRLSILLFGLAQAKYIVPGGRWHDTDGNLINTHASGVTVDKEGKFWWFGEYKPEDQLLSLLILTKRSYLSFRASLRYIRMSIITTNIVMFSRSGDLEARRTLKIIGRMLAV